MKKVGTTNAILDQSFGRGIRTQATVWDAQGVPPGQARRKLTACAAMIGLFGDCTTKFALLMLC